MSKRRPKRRHVLRDLAEDLQDVAAAHPCAHQVNVAIEACIQHICAAAGVHEANERAQIAYNKLEQIEKELRKARR